MLFLIGVTFIYAIANQIATFCKYCRKYDVLLYFFFLYLLLSIINLSYLFTINASVLTFFFYYTSIFLHILFTYVFIIFFLFSLLKNCN